ncbi:Pyruvate decarboxylase [Arachis hypogaea]|nr:Pyruvate decarboxylase [Arachis hypogaea]
MHGERRETESDEEKKRKGELPSKEEEEKEGEEDDGERSCHRHFLHLQHRLCLALSRLVLLCSVVFFCSRRSETCALLRVLKPLLCSAVVPCSILSGKSTTLRRSPLSLKPLASASVLSISSSIVVVEGFFEFDHVEGQRLYRFVAHLQIPLRQEQRIQMNASIAVPVTNRILHHTIGLPDFTQGLRCFQTVTCYQAVVNNLEDAHEMLDTAISTTLKESKPVYISISCNLAAIPYPTFSREPVPFSLSPKLSNQMGLEAVVEAAADFHGNMSV